MELNGSIKALIGAVLVLIACLAAVSVVCDDSDASDTTYVVTLKANGGTASAGSNEKSYSIISGQPFTAPSNTYTKSGYILMGWSESSSGSVKLYPGQSMTITSNKTLYAVWQDLTYVGLSEIGGSSKSDEFEADVVQTTVGGSPTLKFSDDGPYIIMREMTSRGSFQYGLSVTHNGTVLSSVTTDLNTSISADWATLKITKSGELSISGGPTREGVYTVDVTMKTKRLGGSYGDLDDIMLRWYVVVPVSADEQPVLSFSMDGGTGSVNKVQGPAGTATVLPNVTDSSGNQITKDGWTLVGWEIPDGKGSKSVYALGSLYTLSFTTTATAKWIQDPDVLVYSLDGGSLSNVQAYVVYDGDNITLRSTGVTKDGYTFIGWRESYNDQLAYAPGLDITVSGSMYMEAYFVPNGTKLYTVTYDMNGGQGPAELDTQKVEPGMFAFLPKVGMVRDGYEFVGWSTESDGDVINDPGVKIESDTTFYAIWQENIEPEPDPEPVTKYIVTFRVNQGAESYAPQEVRSGGYATEPKEPTRDGYVFLGWKSLTDTDMWDFMRDTVTNDTTLEAQWEQHFTIEYSETKVTVTICQAYYDMAADIYWGDPNDSSGVIGASVGTAEFDYAQKWSGEITVISHDASSDYKSKMHFEVVDGPYVPIPDEWTVTFDPGNGSFPGKSAGETIEQKVLRGNAATYPDEDPSWDDHEFSGWYYEGSEWNFERKVTRNMTLVAAWDGDKPEGGQTVLTPKAVISIKKTENGWKLDGSESVNAVSYSWTLDGKSISNEKTFTIQESELEYGEYKVVLTVVSKTGQDSTTDATLSYPDPGDDGESWLDRNLWMVVAVILIVIALVVVRFWL